MSDTVESPCGLLAIGGTILVHQLSELLGLLHGDEPLLHPVGDMRSNLLTDIADQIAAHVVECRFLVVVEQRDFPADEFIAAYGTHLRQVFRAQGLACVGRNVLLQF